MRQVRLLLSGVGNVGLRFLELIVGKQETLGARLGLELVVVGVADSTGAAVAPAGLVVPEIIRLKRDGLGVACDERFGRRGMSALELVRQTDADLFVEASPANLKDGQPALACIETALSRGTDVVTANKAPLVLAFPRLEALAREHGAGLRYDATVAGGLPAVNLGRRDLAAAEIDRIEGVLNLTTNYILTRMEDDGLGYEAALAEARAAGHAETDPSLDVEGWDAANKLVILANSVLGFAATLQDVAVEGIVEVTPTMLRQAGDAGKRIRLLASAEREGSGYRLTVRPTALGVGHPLARLTAKQLAIVYYTDISGVVTASILEETPIPTAAAVLRDVVLLYREKDL